MAGKKMKEKMDLSKVSDSSKVVVHNKGLRSFLINENGESYTLAPGKTYEVSAKTAKELSAYKGDIEVMSVDGKSAKAVETKAVKIVQDQLEKATQKVADLEKEKQALADELAKHGKIKDREDAVTARETAADERQIELDKQENLNAEQLKDIEAREKKLQEAAQ